MNPAQDPRRPAFSFGRALRKMLPKGSSMPSELASVLNNFEETLAGRIHKLKPADHQDFMQLPWMTAAMEQLSLLHSDVNDLSAALGYRVSNWKDTWMQTYFDDSAKLLDVLNSFMSQIHLLEHSHQYFVSALHHLRKNTPEALANARLSLDKWMGQIGSTEPAIHRCSIVLDGFLQPTDLSKTHDHKENVVMRAMFGFRAVAALVCSVYVAIFSGSVEKVIGINVAREHLWADEFADLQDSVNAEMRRLSSGGNGIMLNELKAVDEGVKKLYPVLCNGDGGADAEGLFNAASDLGELGEQFSQGIALLLKEIDRFFKALLSGRTTLMGKAQHCFFPSGERR